jgi:hypothetical protein
VSLCLAAGALTAALLANSVTLSWTHSVEKTTWEEDWALGPRGLELVEARVQGSGAGMEPPAEARFIGGWWRWRPLLPALPEVTLRRSGATADWRLCIAGECQPIGRYLPADADPVVLRSCSVSS